MDITQTTTTTIPVSKSAEPELENQTQIQPIIKPLSFSNGVLKRHHHQLQHAILCHVAPVAVTYKECLKNHAAAMGVHSVDGCGEFMPSPAATSTDPTSLKCAACGCHRNFHRREPDLDHHVSAPTPLIEYQPHHRHHPPPPPPPQFQRRSPSSSSPPPISSSYAPHMLLALSTGSDPSPRKRFRTKFSPIQKEQMFRFAERVGWKMQKRDDELIQAFCNEAKIDKGVLKVWMHNNKNTFGKRVLVGADNGASGDDKVTNKSNGNHHHHHDDVDDEDEDEDDENGIDGRQLQFGISVAGGAANGGSSSSS